MNPLFSVSGKNVLVTGGSRGIGFMIAQGFVDAGANVLLTSRDETACRQAAHALQCHYVVSNVNSREGCDRLAAQVAKVFADHGINDNDDQGQDQGGCLHVLINNAGTSWGEPLERDSKTNWGFDKVFDLNVKGMFYLTRALFPVLRKGAVRRSSEIRSKETHHRTSVQDDPSNKGGEGIDDDVKAVSISTEDSAFDENRIDDDPARIINIGSVVGLVPQQAPTHAYDISKAAVHHLTRKMAAEYAPYNITVNCVAPGFVPTRMSQGLQSWGADSTRLAKLTPLGRLGTQQDMAGACIYLSSRAGAWCTGVILPVDGGCIGASQIPLMNSHL